MRWRNLSLRRCAKIKLPLSYLDTQDPTSVHAYEIVDALGDTVAFTDTEEKASLIVDAPENARQLKIMLARAETDAAAWRRDDKIRQDLLSASKKALAYLETMLEKVLGRTQHFMIEIREELSDAISQAEGR